MAARTAATRDPLPGTKPRSVGRVTSRLAVTHSAPARIASAASASSGQPILIERPWITATGSSATNRTGARPTAATSAASASVPTTSTFAPAGSRSASIRAALCALVTTSSVTAVNPSSHRCAATSSAEREALLVTNNARHSMLASVSTAPGVGAWPRNTVPSRSRSRQSCCCASVLISVLIAGGRLTGGQLTGRQLINPFFGIGIAVKICRRGVHEPLHRIIGAAERQQDFGVGVEQPRRR